MFVGQQVVEVSFSLTLGDLCRGDGLIARGQAHCCLFSSERRYRNHDSIWNVTANRRCNIELGHLGSVVSACVCHVVEEPTCCEVLNVDVKRHIAPIKHIESDSLFYILLVDVLPSVILFIRNQRSSLPREEIASAGSCLNRTAERRSIQFGHTRNSRSNRADRIKLGNLVLVNTTDGIEFSHLFIGNIDCERSQQRRQFTWGHCDFLCRHLSDVLQPEVIDDSPCHRIGAAIADGGLSVFRHYGDEFVGIESGRDVLAGST